MVHIPTLTQVQLEILRLAKGNAGEVLQLSFELPMMDHGEPPTGNPPVIQELIDLGLIEVQESRVHCGVSRFQQDCWDEYCSDLSCRSGGAFTRFFTSPNLY